MISIPSQIPPLQRYSTTNSPILNSEQIEEFAQRIVSREKFNAFECSVITKLLAKEENKGKIKDWILLLNSGQKAKVVKEVQNFINKNIHSKDIARILFYSTVQKLKEMSVPKKALFITKKAALVPFAPAVLIYKSGKTLATKKGRQSVKAAMKSAANFQTIKSYRVRNKAIKATMKVSASLLATTAIAANSLSLGAATPLTIGLVSALAVTTFAKVTHDIAYQKHVAVILAEVLGASIQATAIGAIDVGLSSLFELSDILLNLIDTSFEEIKDPIGLTQSQVEKDAQVGYSQDSSEAIRGIADNSIDTHQEIVTKVDKTKTGMIDIASQNPFLNRDLKDLINYETLPITITCPDTGAVVSIV